MKTFQLRGPPTLPNDSHISSADDNDDNSDTAVAATAAAAAAAAADDDDGYMDKAAWRLDRVLIKRETGNKNPADKACQFFWLQLQ